MDTEKSDVTYNIIKTGKVPILTIESESIIHAEGVDIKIDASTTHVTVLIRKNMERVLVANILKTVRRTNKKYVRAGMRRSLISQRFFNLKPGFLDSETKLKLSPHPKNWSVESTRTKLVGLDLNSG